MPIYLYECSTCGEQKEQFEKITDPEVLWPCHEECFGLMRRIIGKTSFRLKGRGWSYDGYTAGLGPNEPKEGKW